MSVVCRTEPGETEPITVLPDSASGGRRIVVKDEEQEKKVFREEEEDSVLPSSRQPPHPFPPSNIHHANVHSYPVQGPFQSQSLAFPSNTPCPQSHDYPNQGSLQPPPPFPPSNNHHADVHSYPAQDFHCLILEQLRGISSEIRALQKQVSENTHMLRSLTGGVSGVADLSLPPEVSLPLQDSTELQSLESLLEEDPHLTEKMIAFLATRGGKNIRDAVRRMCETLFSNELAKNINWTGTGEKVAFKNLVLKTIIHKAARKNPVTRGTTEEALQQEVTKYLKGSADRDGGWKKRKILSTSPPSPLHVHLERH